MKVAAGRADQFLKSFDPRILTVLLYGPDAGLVRERSTALVVAIAGSESDPFRVAELTAARLRADPARLPDELGALSLTGGRRVIRVRDAGDELAQILESLLEGRLGDSLLVLEGGDLGARSSLRRLCEQAGRVAAIACYRDEGATLDSFIRESLGGHGIAVEPEAVSYLSERLGGDRLVTRSELEKLAIYVGGAGSVRLEDAVAAVGDSAAIAIDDVVYAAADGELADLERALDRAFGAGSEPVGVLRAAQRHFQRLLSVGARVAAGESLEVVLGTLRPRILFKLADRFRAQVGLWSRAALVACLERLSEGELGCKSTGLPAQVICGRTLVEVALRARSLRRRQ